MNIFSVNQATQLYVADKFLKTGTPAAAGEIALVTTDAGYYFKHYGAGGPIRSDIVDKYLVENVSVKKAAALATTLNKYTVALSTDLNSGNIIPGKDYLLKVTFNGYVGISPEDSQYWKYGVVRTYTGLTASDFYKKMAISLARNLSREATKIATVSLASSTTETEVTARTKETALTGTYTGIVISEVEPEWMLGLKQQKIITIDVTTPDVEYKDGDGIVSGAWGTVTKSAGTSLNNGKTTADLEYFFAGEKGDQYRMVGFPDYVPTKYLVDPTKGYDYLTIHYSYVGSNESVQKSEKDIIIVAPTGGTVVDDIMTALNS